MGMKVRRWSTALVISSLVAVGLMAAGGPAQAFNPGLNNGSYKLVTVWGGGYAINVGEKVGSTLNGQRAKLYHNTHWDNANRWFLRGEWLDQSTGFTWYQIENRHSHQCLAAEQLVPGSTNHWENIVVQRPCDWNQNNQFWRQHSAPSSPDGTVNGVIRNYDYMNRPGGGSMGWVLSSVFPRELSEMSMLAFDTKVSQYWVLRSCPDQQDC